MSEGRGSWASDDLDRHVRQAAFDFLAAETARRGEVLPWHC